MRIRLSIDGASTDVPAGTTVLAAARSIGTEIPTLCDDPRLVPTGACRLCLVEVSGWARPVAACAARVEEGMAVRTATPALEAERRMILELLAQGYPASVGSRPPTTVFERYLRRYGVAARGPERPPEHVDESHPYIRVDMSRCIDCFRCVRICQDVQGQDVWHLWDRGVDTIVHPAGPSLLESPCVGCGACVDTCPSGALEDRRTPAQPPAIVWTRTTCPYCGVGCELEYGAQEGRIVAARPVIDAPVNRGHACVKGRYAFEFVHASDRVVHPLIRRGQEWEPVVWSEAIGFAGRQLLAIVDRYGPDAVGVLGSARATNEENYLIQKLARGVIGTNNVDCCARVCHAPSAAGLKSMLGAGAATNSFDDIEQAATILVWGANVTESHPVIGARIRQAARRGTSLIVVDPRRTEIAAEATIHLAIRPGTNVPLLNAMARTIIAEGLYDDAFVVAHVDGIEALRAAVGEWTPERAAAVCGVTADSIARAARLYAAHRPAMSVHGLGLTEHTQGTEGVCALVNLALLTGNVGRPGAGVNPLRGQNNVQGAAQMGCDPDALPGGVAIEEARAPFEAAWGRPLPRTRGLKLLDMIDAASEGRLKALIVVGYDILLTNPHVDRTRRALERLELLIVQDLFQTQTSSLAHVFLPACSSFEKDGTFMNAERRVQRVRKLIEPIGQSRPDSEITADLARALGGEDLFRHSCPNDVWDEIRRLWPAAAGMTYERLESHGLQWPCPTVDHPGTPMLYATGFARGRVALRPIEFRATEEIPDSRYPFLLTTGRTLHQFNAGTMTDRTPNHELRPADMLEITSEDAQSLGVATGEVVRVTSRYGQTVLPVHITSGMRPGHVFATFHTATAFVNRVTSDRRDAIGTPEYKVTAVRIDRVADATQAAASGRQTTLL